AIVFVLNVAVVVAAGVGALVGHQVAGPTGLIVATILSTYGIAQFGELIPKVLAARANETFALSVATPTVLLTRVLSPIVAVLGWFPGVLSRAIYGSRLDAGPAVSEAELRMLLDLRAEFGAVGEADAELL